jgi:trimethylamine:corrinoid methyltransferase-like protein
MSCHLIWDRLFGRGSKIADLQAAYEGVIPALTVSMAQGSICWGAGIINNLMAIDYAKLIMDAEAAGNIRILFSKKLDRRAAGSAAH